MPKLRALVVDDAAVMRRLVSEVLQRDPQIEIAGTASNGRLALQRLEQVNPDFVTLDVEMPELDGLQTLRALRRTHPRLPVIMLSMLTMRGAVATLDALAAGATDYVTKPGTAANLDEAIQRLSQELLPKVHAHCAVAATRSAPLSPERVVRRPAPAPARSGGREVDLVCLATSTGGPNALTVLFDRLTAPPSVPVVIVQHMPPMFTGLLAERLDARPGALRCHEAQDGEPLLAGQAYLAPGGRHLTVERAAAGGYFARLTDSPPENSCRPAADVLFRSAAQAGASTLAVVMTGMGEDGLRGCQHLRETGATILVQDEASSVVWGMPGAVARAGLADLVVPLDALPVEIVKRLPLHEPATP
ncbi:MAG: chemotaxis response regulator protein-glutamate methylesterase [Verrucomicrobia bacterium]|nr:chemotaxis response regulator protein-glutamate methylesterase [Verrucomicrobiota bacterium]